MLDAVSAILTLATQIQTEVLSGQLEAFRSNWKVIGTMGILISCAGFILIVLYNRGVSPLLALSNQIGAEEDKERMRLSCSPEAGREIVALVESINEMIADCRRVIPSNGSVDSTEHELLSQTVNETTNGLNAVINYAELLLESDSGALSEEQRKMRHLSG